VAVEDVIHLRDGFDPNNLRKGLSPLRSLFREVFTDDEAANMTASLMKNLGVPGLVLSPEGDTSISPDEAERIKAWLDEKYTGDNRGQPLVMSAASKTSTFGFNPEQMQMRELRKIPEERITAVIGVPAIVAGLGAGLDRSTYANYKEAREAAYEGTILPMQRLIGSTLKRQGLSEYEDDLLHWNVKYDLSGVRILQEDENKRVERINNMVTGGYVKVRDAQEMTGVPIDDTQDYYLRPFNVVPVESGPAPVSIASNSKELKFSMDSTGECMS
jgi:HK97 family phage portal protein